jgi:hypothetical protein
VEALTANIAAYFVEVRQEGAEAVVREQLLVMEKRQEEILGLLRKHSELLAAFAPNRHNSTVAVPQPERREELPGRPK